MRFLPRIFPGLPACLAFGTVVAGDVTILPVADTCLFELDSTHNFGAHPDLPAGGLGELPVVGKTRARALFKFDVAGTVPAGATITSAEMVLYVTKVPKPPSSQEREASDFALTRVLVDWGEGVKTAGENPGGVEATAGESTWIHRFYNPDLPELDTWSLPGGQFGVDYATGQSAVKDEVDLIGDKIFHFNATGIADLQSMLADPGLNYGWVLHSLSEDNVFTARRWASREWHEIHRRPSLTIAWTVPVNPPEILTVALNEARDAVLVRVAGLEGFSYQMETSGDLIGWTPGEVQVPAANGEILFSLPVETRGFLRVQVTQLP